MGDLITLVAEVAGEHATASGDGIRLARREDVVALGRLYFEAYDPGIACDSLEEAVQELEASFAGDYGVLLGEASLVALDGEALIGAVMTVHRPTWDGLPECPFIIELIVDRAHRRRGVGRRLLKQAMSELARMDESQVGLNVDVANTPARDLYESMGFRAWSRA